jgi:hypothetical protein
MSLALITRAYHAKQLNRVLIFTNSRIYDGEIADYPDGNKGVGSDTVHLVNVKMYSSLNQELGEYPAITVNAAHIEAFSL